MGLVMNLTSFSLMVKTVKIRSLNIYTLKKKRLKNWIGPGFFPRMKMKNLLNLSRISFFSAVNMVQGPSRGFPTEEEST